MRSANPFVPIPGHVHLLLPPSKAETLLRNIILQELGESLSRGGNQRPTLDGLIQFKLNCVLAVQNEDFSGISVNAPINGRQHPTYEPCSGL